MQALFPPSTLIAINIIVFNYRIMQVSLVPRLLPVFNVTRRKMRSGSLGTRLHASIYIIEVDA